MYENVKLFCVSVYFLIKMQKKWRKLTMKSNWGDYVLIWEVQINEVNCRILWTSPNILTFNRQYS